MHYFVQCKSSVIEKCVSSTRGPHIHGRRRFSLVRRKLPNNSTGVTIRSQLFKYSIIMVFIIFHNMSIVADVEYIMFMNISETERD